MVGGNSNMLQIVEGRLMNSRDVGNAVAELLLKGMPIDQISNIKGMPTAGQIAIMRKQDPAFADALKTAFEGAGIESAFTLMSGARTGNIGKNQLEAAKWVAERMAPDLFQERKTIINEEAKLSDEELAFQLQAAARSDERVMKILKETGMEVDGEVISKGNQTSDKTRVTLRQLKRFTKKHRMAPKP